MRKRRLVGPPNVAPLRDYSANFLPLFLRLLKAGVEKFLKKKTDNCGNVLTFLHLKLNFYHKMQRKKRLNFFGFWKMNVSTSTLDNFLRKSASKRKEIEHLSGATIL